MGIFIKIDITFSYGIKITNYWLVGNLVTRAMWWHDLEFLLVFYCFFILWSSKMYGSCLWVSLVIAHVSHGYSSFFILVCEPIYWYISLKSLNMLWRLWWWLSWHISRCDLDMNLDDYLGYCWHKILVFILTIVCCSVEWEVSM